MVSLYWSVKPNREEKTRLFAHGYYGDAAVIAGRFCEPLPHLMT